MAVVDVLRALVVAGAATTGALANPSELVIDDIPGFELTSRPVSDLTYEEYAELEPDSVAHLDPESEEAVGMLAAIEVWTGRAPDDVIVVELIRAIDDEAATTFVDQAAANSIAVGLAATDPPFGGAWSYSGAADDGWTNIVAWNQGPYAVMLTQVTPVETDRATIDPAAVRQVEIILDATGAEVSEDAAVADDAPTPPTDASAPEETETGGFPVGTVVLVLAVVAVAAGVLLQQRRKYPGST
jgi:hypothetical protein